MAGIPVALSVSGGMEQPIAIDIASNETTLDLNA